MKLVSIELFNSTTILTDRVSIKMNVKYLFAVKISYKLQFYNILTYHR